MSKNAETAYGSFVSALPRLPKIVRYWDDFKYVHRTIRDIGEVEEVALEIDGKPRKYILHEYGVLSDIMRHAIVDWLGHADPTTVAIHLDHIRSYVRSHDALTFFDLICSKLPEARRKWHSDILPSITAPQSSGLKAILHSLCNISFGYWDPHRRAYVRSFSTPRVDPYRVVRTGECFVPLDQQARIINYLDEYVLAHTRSPPSANALNLRDACILVLSFQYALRPGQIARIERSDVRVFETGAVHVAVLALKQRDPSKTVRTTRRIRREWAPLFSDYLDRHKRNTETEESREKLFGMTPHEVGLVLTNLYLEVTGDDWTATDARHTAAQRLADAGMSHTALSEFMMHSSTKTATVYFDASPAQAQRINEALAISPIYAHIPAIARTRTIDKKALLGLPEDNQIGGIPHGVPIAGIGKCELGQSLCAKNPVLSCYTCRRFMPLNDPAIHEHVITQLRPVIVAFAEASRGNENSPAYAQMKATFESARRVAEAIRQQGNRPDE